MKLKLLYDTLRIEVFDTNELTEKKALGDRNLLTNYELRMDRIDGDRLWLEVLWYDANYFDNGCKGFLVLTGEADMQTVAESDVKPTCIYESLNEMRKYL